MPIIKNLVCPVCGCLCDDIEVLVEGNIIKEVRNACALGEGKLLYFNNHRLLKPLIRKNGELVEASLDEAIRRSVKILSEASYPILYGWSSTSCEAIRVGIELAEEIGGVIDNTSTVCHGPSILSIQDVGMSTCTLGQIRHRADLVIYWGSNPWNSHPRHLRRYTTLTEGRFQGSLWRRYLHYLSSGQALKRFMRAMRRMFRRRPETSIHQKTMYQLSRSGRKMIVVDVRRTRTADFADYFIQVEPNRDYEVLQALRMLIRDEELEVDEVAGVPVNVLEEIADVMLSCRFGVLFFGLGLTMSRGKMRNIDAALSLVRDLNRYTKFLIMPMRGHFNVSGANVVFTWQTGYPYAVDLSQGYPRYNPGETSVVDILSRGESDAALIVASDPVSNFPQRAVENLVKNPMVVIDPHFTPTSMMADVVIPSAFVGIEAYGTAYRMDRVPLPLKKIVNPPSNILTDEEILRRILNGVRKANMK